MENSHSYPKDIGMKMLDCSEGRLDEFRLFSITYCIDYGREKCPRTCHYAIKQKRLEEKLKRR